MNAPFEPSSIRSLSRVLLLCVFAIAGCDPCPERVQAIGCKSDAECAEQNRDPRWVCQMKSSDVAVGDCVLNEQRICEDENFDPDTSLCCPGQVCNLGAICEDRYDLCEADADCAVKGQRCQDRQINGSTQTVCTFDRCDTSGGCPEGLDCFGGYCVGENPCKGSCAAGSACAPSNNTCHPNAGCDVSCGPGYLATFTDPDNVDNGCKLLDVACECAPLPPLRVADLGRHSGVAHLASGGVAVSAFDGDFQDLVVITFDAAGKKTGANWVDGLPTGGTPVADPNGPRAGISDAGPAVGRYTSVAAAADGTLHVAYYDIDNGDLKYARGSGETWAIHTVDSAGDTGLYTSIALDAGGAPWIAYFQKAGADPDAGVTAARLAQASSATPGAASDWAFVDLATATLPPPPCGGGCGAGEVCASIGGAPAACAPESAGCAAGACGTGEVCVTTGGSAACADEVSLTGLDGLPSGTGLFCDLTFQGAEAAVAFYDAQAGALKVSLGASPAGASAGTIHTLGAAATVDTGRFPSIAGVGGGKYGVIFEDPSADDLAWAEVDSTGFIASGVVDDGIRDPSTSGTNLVGADASLVFDGGEWHAFYQDATLGDLMRARRASDGTWTHSPLVTEGAAGFWADAVAGEGKIFVSHTLLNAARVGPMNASLKVEVVAP